MNDPIGRHGAQLPSPFQQIHALSPSRPPHSEHTWAGIGLPGTRLQLGKLAQFEGREAIRKPDYSLFFKPCFPNLFPIQKPIFISLIPLSI